MASIRVTVKQEARRLAADDDACTAAGDYRVPAAAITRLQQMLQTSSQPVNVLRWAWRSQLATYVDSNSRLDGLATMYLQAALLDIQDERGGQH